MSRTPSTMLTLGTQAPDFNLPEPLTGNSISLADFSNKPLLVAFICNHCPYVLHIMNEFVAFAEAYKGRGLAVVAINVNDVANYPDDSPEKMAELAKQAGFSFPYLFDASQASAQAYQAACTPDFYLFNADHQLYYRGQFDDARPRSDVPVTGKDMKAAADALLAGKIAPSEQIASLGCNIKWISGNEPDYF